jgi:hypothetical protein
MIVTLQKRLKTMAHRSSKTYLRGGARTTTTAKKERRMIAFLKTATAPAAIFAAAITFGAMTASEASAGEFCRQDVTGHMTGCGYSSMEQCQAASAGVGGDCFRDPNLSNSANNDSGNALAYQPKSSRTRKGSPAAGPTTNTNQ